MHTRQLALVAALLAAVTTLAACSGSDNSASPPAQTTDNSHYVVSLGDSYISGEGDRWAGNTNGSYREVDALGPFAYAGPYGLEDIPGCHRSVEPEAAVNYGDVQGENLACSGAETATKLEGDVFKPGIDFYHQKTNIGQALALQQFATNHDVTAVVLSIGGNNFNFSTILATCVEDFATTSGSKPTYCSDDRQLRSYFSASHIAAVRQQIDGAIKNITTAMTRAGRSASDYRIIVQNYPSPLPPAADLRYPQTVAARFTLGGCPFFDKDANWANATALATINATVKQAVAASGVDNITLLDLSQAFVGHRLCENGATQMQESGLTSWRSPGAANELEWINQIYLKGIPWQQQESAHPNYWGTAAERNCLRQVVKGATTASVACVRDGTAMSGMEPAMKLVG